MQNRAPRSILRDSALPVLLTAGAMVLVCLAPAAAGLGALSLLTLAAAVATQRPGGRRGAWLAAAAAAAHLPLALVADPAPVLSSLALCVAVTLLTRRSAERRLGAEAALASAHANLVGSAKLSTLGEMAAGIAHEINNPLSIIDGRARQLQRLLRAATVDGEQARRVAESIVETTLRIARIVKGLSGFARNAELDPLIETPLAAVIDGTTALCYERLRALRVRLTVDPVPAGLSLACREAQLSQVLLNLLGNAVDAVAASDERWVRLGVRDVGGFVELSVTDSGPGVPSALRESLFEPFVTSKPMGKGTGLGLSISRNLVELHGGTLTLDEASDATRFLIRLPKPAGAGYAKAG